MPSHGVVSLRARPYLRLARSQVKERRTSTTASGQSASILQLALAGSVNAEFGRTEIPRHVASPAGLFLRFFEILSCFYGAVKAVTPENVVQARGAPGRLNGKDGLNRGWLRVQSRGHGRHVRCRSHTRKAKATTIIAGWIGRLALLALTARLRCSPDGQGSSAVARAPRAATPLRCHRAT